MASRQCLPLVTAQVRSLAALRRSSIRLPPILAVRALSTRANLVLLTRRSTIDLPSVSRTSYIQHRNYGRTQLLAAEKIVKVPDMAESITEGTLKSWSKQVGDYVERDEEIASIETDKIDVAVNAPEAGTIKELLAKEEDTVTVGQDLVKLETGGASQGGGGEVEAKSEPKGPASADQQTASQPSGEQEQAKPQETKEEKKPEPPKQEQAPAHSPPPQPSQQQQPPTPPREEKKPQAPKKETAEPKKADQVPFGSREERRVKMNRMRLRIAERLKQSQNTAASLTTFNEVDMSAIMDFRKQYKDEVLKRTGVKLGFMSAFTRACVLGMREVPTVNASIEGPGGGDTIVYRDYVDVSVAVATEKGLVTPVVRNAESMDMIGVEKAIAELGKKARDNKLTIEDMAGGTFTISNGGVFGSLMGTPIINLPQTAVLGLHAIKDRPVVINGKIEIRPMMYLALTYDHRLLDGREAVTFLIKVKEFIEDPRRMLLA